MSEHKSPSGAKFMWFGHGQDVEYLEAWRHVPLNYRPGQPVDATFHSDHHQDVLIPKADAAVFNRAADLLLRYHFYPAHIMTHISDFSRENRHMRKGDRILQRIHGVRLLGYGIFDALTMNEIWSVIDEPRQAGFTYITTQAHAEKGEWTAHLEWRDDDAVVLTITALSRLARDLPVFMQHYARRAQLRAHHDGMENFQRLVIA
ncbi:MAG: DUF1990 domain-containing protein [Anaerolineae bacterium]|nr:DUF1990 domain-containing protein [Anaerolineae bacterium]